MQTSTTTAAAEAFAAADIPFQCGKAAYEELLAFVLKIQQNINAVLAERKPATPVRFNVWGEGRSRTDPARVVVTLSNSKRDGQYWGTKYDIASSTKRYGGDGYMVTKNAAWVKPQGVRNIFSKDDNAFAGKFTLSYPISGNRVMADGIAGAARDIVGELIANYPDREILREAMVRAGLAGEKLELHTHRPFLSI